VCRVPSGGGVTAGGGVVVATVAGGVGTLSGAMSYDTATVRRKPGHDQGKDAFAAGEHARNPILKHQT
jgi:L-serine deaminase